MSLASRITDLAIAVRDKINLMMPRLLPAGGTAGQVVKKTGPAPGDTAWQDEAAGGGGGGAVNRDGGNGALRIGAAFSSGDGGNGAARS